MSMEKTQNRYNDKFLNTIDDEVFLKELFNQSFSIKNWEMVTKWDTFWFNGSSMSFFL